MSPIQTFASCDSFQKAFQVSRGKWQRDPLCCSPCCTVRVKRNTLLLQVKNWNKHIFPIYITPFFLKLLTCRPVSWRVSLQCYFRKSIGGWVGNIPWMRITQTYDFYTDIGTLEWGDENCFQNLEPDSCLLDCHGPYQRLVSLDSLLPMAITYMSMTDRTVSMRS